MKILYLTQWFNPEPAFKGVDFARALADAGHEVEVATGFPNYPGGKIYPGYRIRPYGREVMEGITVHRLALYPSHDASSLKRIVNYVSFFLSALLFGIWRGRSYDLVYIYHPPLTPALAGALFCALNRRPFVVEIQDLWPDSVEASGMANPHIVRALSAACNFVYRRAARIIAQSDGMSKELVRRGVPRSKLATIFNWATYRTTDVAAEIPPSVRDSFFDRINLVYGGNLGQAQQLAVVVESVIAAHAREPRVRLHLVGDGIEKDEIQDMVVACQASDIVHFHGTVSRELMDRIFEAADILVMHLAPDPLYDITIPSKTQHYLACGKPIIAGLSGEAAQILERSGAAVVSAPGDVAAMATAITRMARRPATERAALGQAGANYYAEHFAFGGAIASTSALLNDVLVGPRNDD